MPHRAQGKTPATAVAARPAHAQPALSAPNSSLLPSTHSALAVVCRRQPINDASPSGQTVMIVLNLFDAVIGIVVDLVSDTVGFGAGDIKEAPGHASNLKIDHVTGIGGSRFQVRLDFKRRP
jgi:hypothetical protein